MHTRIEARWREVWALASIVGLSLAGSGCFHGGDEAPSFALVEVRTFEMGAPLRLNDDVILEFTAPIDPSTLTRDAVALVDEDTGSVARGRWIVDGRTLRFSPAAPRQANLLDGGLQPGATYELRLAGFPSVSGLRSADGHGLARPLVKKLEVVSLGPGRPLLRDASPDVARRLELRPDQLGADPSRPLPWNSALLVACSEPIDPRTLDASDFEIAPMGGSEATGGPSPNGFLGGSYDRSNGSATVPIASIRLIHNADEIDDFPGSAPAGAVLRFEPSGGLPLRPGARTARFQLRVKEGAPRPALSDYSGRSPYRGPLQFFAARHGDDVSESEASYEFDFEDDSDFWPGLDSRADGTARWSGNGRVDIRYPAAAGTGRDGPERLDGEVAVSDLHATSIDCPAGTEVSLPATGMVVLRAQGRIDIDGRLVRRTEEAPNPMWSSEPRPKVEWLEASEDLSTWLAGAIERDECWTVIVAGGDLVVNGTIEVDTPLLLVAGGRIRGRARPETRPGQCWLLGDGGFDLPFRGGSGEQGRMDPPLRIDEPIVNPLVRPLTFVAISSPAPKAAAPRLWGRSAVVSSGDTPGGSVRVQYLPANALSRGEDDPGQAVPADEPMGALEADSTGSRVRLRIVLTVEPHRGPWEPPFLDRLRLTWTPE